MKKILFVGNSHTYFNDMPQMVRELFTCAGEPVSAAMLTHGGKTLDWHFHQEQTRFNILYGEYDFVVLQQAAHPFDGYQALSDGVSAIRGLAEGLPCQFVLYMTWAEKARPENQPEMSEAYIRAAKEQGTLLAPVGEIWRQFRKEHPERELYFTDGAHASPLGSFLAACCIFRAVSGGNLPETIQQDKGVLGQLDACALQEILDFVRKAQFPSK